MFDDRLLNLRLNKGISAKECAKQLDIPYSTYRHYENDDREPTGQIMSRIASFFNVSIDYLMGRKDNPAPIDTKKNSSSKTMSC